MTAESAITNVLPEIGIDLPLVNLADGPYQPRQLLSLVRASHGARRLYWTGIAWSASA